MSSQFSTRSAASKNASGGRKRNRSPSNVITYIVVNVLLVMADTHRLISFHQFLLALSTTAYSK